MHSNLIYTQQKVENIKQFKKSINLYTQPPVFNANGMLYVH